MAEPSVVRGRTKSLADLASQYRRAVDRYAPGGYASPNWRQNEPIIERLLGGFQRAVRNSLSQTREGRAILDANPGNLGNLSTFGVLIPTEGKNRESYRNLNSFGITERLLDRQVSTRKRRRY